MTVQPSEIITRLDSIELLLKDIQRRPLSLDEAAKYLHVSKSHLYKLTSQNRIPYYKPGGKLVYFDKVELDQWILQNRVKTRFEIENEAMSHLNLKRGGRNG